MKVKKKSLDNQLDFIGIIASLICAVHCVALPFVLTLSAFSGFLWLANPTLEWSFLGISFIVATSSLFWSYFQKHKSPQALWVAAIAAILLIASHIGYSGHAHWMTAFGGLLLAIAHAINWLLIYEKPPFPFFNWYWFIPTVLAIALFSSKLRKTDQQVMPSRRELLEVVWQAK